LTGEGLWAEDGEGGAEVSVLFVIVVGVVAEAVM